MPTRAAFSQFQDGLYSLALSLPALDRPPLIDFIEMPAELRGKYQYFTQADIGKLRTIGYAAATTPLADAVRDYVQNYLVPDRRLG